MRRGFVLSLVGTAHAIADKGIGGVIEMLKEMKVKGEAEAQSEKQTFSKFTQWCTGTQTTLGAAIGHNKEEIQLKTAEFEENSALDREKGAAIKKAGEGIAALQNAMMGLTNNRTAENANFTHTEAELVDNIAACKTAESVLKGERDAPTQASLLQLTRGMSNRQKETIRLLLQKQDPEVGMAPEWSHESSSGDVIEMIVSLGKEFTTQLQTRRDKEGTAQGNYDLIMSEKTNQRTLLQSDIDRWSLEQGKARTDAANAAASKQAMEQTLSSNLDSERMVKTTCKKRSDEFTSRQTLRSEEFQAIDQAVDALRGALGKGPKEESLMEVALIQLLATRKSNITNNKELVQQAAKMLRLAGLKQNNKRLQLLALSVSEAGPLDDAIAMVRKLKNTLEKEWLEEARRKWTVCTQKLDKNQENVDYNTGEKEKFSADFDKADGTAASLADEIEQYLADESDAAKQISEAKKLRMEDSKENAQVIKEATTAIEGLELAIKIISEFQVKAAEAKVFAQEDPVAVSVPETWNEAYKGQQSAHNDVGSVLEMLLAEYRKEKQDTEHDEKSESKKHGDYLDQKQLEKAQRTSNLENARTLKAQAIAEREEANGYLQEAISQLESLSAEKKDILEGQGCKKYAYKDQKTVEAEEKEDKAKEIEALEQGLKILTDTNEKHDAAGLVA